MSVLSRCRTPDDMPGAQQQVLKSQKKSEPFSSRFYSNFGSPGPEFWLPQAR